MPSIDSLSITITASTASAKTRIEELTEALGKLNTAIAALDVSKFEKLADVTNDLSQGFANLKGMGVKEVKAIAKAIQTVSSEKGSLDPVAKSAEKVVEKTQQISENTEKVSEGLGKIDSSATDEMAQSLSKVSSTLEVTTQKMSTFKTILAKTRIIIPTEGLDKVDKRIDKLTERIADLKDKLNFKSQTQSGYIDSDEMEKDQEKIDGLINELNRLKLKKQELESNGGFKLNVKSWGFNDVHSALKNINKGLDKFVSKMFRARSATRDTSKATQDFSIASMKLAKELTRVTKMLKLMVTRMVLRKVIQNTVDGFKNLIQYSSETNASISLLWNSFRQLGNAVAAAASPLLNALAPVLNYLIQLCIKLVNAINQVISALTGKSTWTRAKKLSDDYGASLDKSNKSAKELKRTILGFDELNVLQDNNDSGGGAGGTSPADMFEEAAIDDKWKKLADYIKNLAKKLFEPIKKAWEKVGDFVKKSWKYALDEVLNLGKSVARDFWKVWEQEKTQKIFENIFKTIGWIGQAVGNLAKRFREAWDENETGFHILENIRDIVLIVTEHIESMAKATAEWADNLDFGPILNSFKDWLESMKPVIDGISGAFEDFYTQVLLPLGKWSIEEGLPELIQVFTDFNDKVDWEGLRQKLSDLWDHIEPFAERVGEGLIQFIRDCSDALADFLNSKTFEHFLDVIKKWMDDVDADDVARTLKLVAGAIITLKAALFALEGIKGLNATVGALKSFFALFGGGAAAAGAGAGASGAAGAAGTAGAIASTAGAIDKLAVATGVLWDNMSKFGQGIFNAGATIAFFDNIKQINKQGEIGRLSDDLAKGNITLAEYKKAVDELDSKNIQESGYSWKQFWKDFFNPMDGRDMGDSLTSLFKMLKDNTSTYRGEYKALIAEYAQGNITTVEFKKKLEDLKKKYGEVAETSKKSAVDIRAGAADVSKSADGMSGSFNKFRDDVTVDFEEVDSAVANTNTFMYGQTREISQSVDGMGTDIETTTDKIKDSFSEDKWTFSGVIDGLSKTFGDAVDAVKRKWNELASINGEYSIGFGNMKIHFPKFFARGGFPDIEDGWFRASHGEMLGKFDNGQSVVANNEQIVDGIRQGVYEAVSMAMSTSQGGNNVPVYTTIQIGEEQVARAVTRGQRKLDRRYSPTMA